MSANEDSRGALDQNLSTELLLTPRVPSGRIYNVPLSQAPDQITQCCVNTYIFEVLYFWKLGENPGINLLGKTISEDFYVKMWSLEFQDRFLLRQSCKYVVYAHSNFSPALENFKLVVKKVDKFEHPLRRHTGLVPDNYVEGFNSISNYGVFSRAINYLSPR